jgi:hypothetical protein
MKNLLFHLKAMKTGTHKSSSQSRSGNFLKVGVGAGAKSNSFGSATLVIRENEGTLIWFAQW